MTVTFDPVRYKDTTRAQWEEAAAEISTELARFEGPRVSRARAS